MDRKAIRQGDVLVMPCSEPLPEAAAPVAPEGGRVVLAHGEVTGHHHSFALSDRVALFREDGSGGGAPGPRGTWLQVAGDAPVMLEHQEHTALAVPPGLHRVIRQRVFQAGMAQRVAD